MYDTTLDMTISLTKVSLYMSNGDIYSIDQIESSQIDVNDYDEVNLRILNGRLKPNKIEGVVCSMLSAEEARAKAETAVARHLEYELSFFADKIKEACNEGEMSVSYDGTISRQAKEELEKLGYKVEIGSQYNQSYVLIGWKK